MSPGIGNSYPHYINFGTAGCTHAGTRIRSKKSKRVTQVSTAPSPDIPPYNLPDIQQDIQLAVKNAVSATIRATIPAIVEQLRTDQPTPNPSRNVAEQQESEANMTIHQHIESFTCEQQAPVSYDYDQSIPLDLCVYQTNREKQSYHNNI